MDSLLVNNIVAAATSASAVSHLKNDLNKSVYGDRSHIDAFQDEILTSLNNAYGGNVWEKEYKVPGMIDKDAIDIYGTPVYIRFTQESCRLLLWSRAIFP